MLRTGRLGSYLQILKNAQKLDANEKGGGDNCAISTVIVHLMLIDHV